MADLTISSAATLTGAQTEAGDLFPLIDVSAAAGSQGSKITRDELGVAMVATPALSAALALKLDKAGGIITGNGAASTPALTLNGTPFSGGTAETTKPFYLLEPTGTTSNNWSTGGTMFGSNAASGFAGDLINLQLAAANRFKVASTGQFLFTKASGTDIGSFATEYGTISLATTGSADFVINRSVLSEGGAIGAASPAFNRAGRLWAADDIGNCLELRQGTNVNVFRVYGTYTDASNYERLGIITAAGAYQIKPEAAGAGTLRDLHISGLPTSNPGPGILWNNAGTPAIGT